MSGNLNAFLAALGSFFNINSRVSVVTIAALFGVPRILFVPCYSDILTCAPRPISEYDADESKKAVVLVGLGGLVQPGCLPSLRILKVLKTRLFPAGAPCHFPIGALPKPAFAVLLPMSLPHSERYTWAAARRTQVLETLQMGNDMAHQRVII